MKIPTAVWILGGLGLAYVAVKKGLLGPSGDAPRGQAPASVDGLFSNAGALAQQVAPLFNNSQSDNTAALISSGASAGSSFFGALGKLFGGSSATKPATTQQPDLTPLTGTPVDPNYGYGFDDSSYYSDPYASSNYFDDYGGGY